MTTVEAAKSLGCGKLIQPMEGSEYTLPCGSTTRGVFGAFTWKCQACHQKSTKLAEVKLPAE